MARAVGRPPLDRCWKIPAMAAHKVVMQAAMTATMAGAWVAMAAAAMVQAVTLVAQPTVVERYSTHCSCSDAH